VDQWFGKMSREAEGGTPESGPYTVADAVADYLAGHETDLLDQGAD